MAGKTAVLAIRIISDATKAARGMQEVETRAERMGRRVQKAGRIGAVGLLAIGAAGLKAADAAAADQAAQVNLANSISKSTNATTRQIDQVEKYIDKTARATGVTDDELRPAFDKLVGSTKSIEKSQEALNLAMDVSARTGKPLAMVSNALAKGYGGNTTALGRLVPGIDQAVLASKDMTKITKELAKMTGGAAAKAAETSAGKTARMKLAYGELQEQLGSYLLPALSTFATVLTSVASFVQENDQAVIAVVTTLGTFAAAVVTLNAGMTAYKSVQTAATTAQIVFNGVMAANPILLVVVAITLLIAGFVLAYKKSETFRNAVRAVGEVGKDAFEAYISPIETVIGWIKKLIKWVSEIDWPSPPGWVKDLGGLVGLGGDSTHPRAPGGRVPAGGRGGPGGGAMMVAAGGGGGVNVTIQTDGLMIGDVDSLARALANLLDDAARRRGGR